MSSADVIVIGGGIAGMSAAAALSRHARVTVLEAEAALGYHSSGRSATYYHFGIGNRPVRAMTAFSREFFEHPPADFADSPFCHPTPALFVARPEMVDALAALEAEMRQFTDTIERIDERGMLAMVPVLKTGDDGIVEGVVDHGGRRLDADRLLQAYVRKVKQSDGATVTAARVVRIEHKAGLWELTTERGEQFCAPVVVNAAGAWADQVAALAGVHPIGLAPKRRTVILFDPPSGIDAKDWPFVKAAVDDFYMIPESGRILASPVDEVDSCPVDAQPEEYDLALAAWKVEEYTTMTVPRIQHRWAGLRSFVSDRVPTAGYAPDADGFFWLAGQGGYGLQTAPAMAEIVSALITGGAWPKGLAALGLTPEQVLPDRLIAREVS